MIRQLLSLYRPGYPTVLVYMLQTTEYQVGPYLEWLHRTKDFSDVTKRRTLDPTKRARLLLLALRVGITLQILAGLLLIYLGLKHHVAGGAAFGAALIIVYPFAWAYLIVLPLLAGRQLSAAPQERRQIAASEKIFADHAGVKIAVAGSYGKTTMKELLKTVLGEGLDVTATPDNKNVSSSHARFAAGLTGREDVLIIEYGEGAPGDVAGFAANTHPTHAVITGLAPAHLDKYPSLKAAGEDIFSVTDYLKGKNVYVSGDSPSIKPFLKETYHIFDAKGALGWKVEAAKTDLAGTDLTLKKGTQTLNFHSGLIGSYKFGYLAFVAALAMELGLTPKQVEAGMAKTTPFEHRMQPYRLNGANIVDDTYNGNLEGIRAGTALLKELAAKRKIYVTPGLVDQGEENERVHHEVGKLIATAQPDLVVLMKNSVTGYIQKGLKEGGFKGELRVEENPMDFYANLSHFVAAGDLVVMQNDWTDNYA
jgi:UDP-N-acetylmuramoyl-tripeptide--D-alanyl-D-alanine ligase